MAGLLCAPVLAASAQNGQTPDECYRFAFGSWNPPLKTVANRYNPGTDPTSGAAPGTPRDWAARAPTTPPAGSAKADSVLLLFPSWWPSGVSIDWKDTRGDTLVGVAHALVADGRVEPPVTSVRGIRIPCEPARPDRTP